MHEEGAEPGSWPSGVREVFDGALTCEYASLTRAGSPVTVPSTPYVGEAGTLDVSTGLSYPAKAERARRNPKVALLFADAIGTGAADAPVVLVQGHAAVRDADLQTNTDRYVRLSLAKLPAAVDGQPKAILRRMTFYYARIWIELTPVRISWWPDRTLSVPAQVWQAPATLPLPASDPPPSGRQPPAWLKPPEDGLQIAAQALRSLPFADLTTVARDGMPVCVPVTASALEGGQVPLSVGTGAPDLSAGPACLTVHGHDERFTTQENHTLVGSLAEGGNGLRLKVERVLPDWSLTGNRLQIGLGFLRKGRTLRPRVKAEAARRGQAVPRVNIA